MISGVPESEDILQPWFSDELDSFLRCVESPICSKNQFHLTRIKDLLIYKI
jgi:hypothetical protein